MSSGLLGLGRPIELPAPELPELRIPPFERHRLGGGLDVITAPDPSTPLVHLRYAARAGASCDPPGREGTAALLASLLAEEGAEAGERRGGVDAFSGLDWDTGYLAAEALWSDLEPAVQALASRVAGPRFDASAVASLRRRRLAELDRRSRDAAAVADDTFARLAFAGSRFGLPLGGSRASVAGIAAPDVAAFHRERFAAGGSLVATGCFQPEDLLRQVEAVWPAAGNAAPPLPQGTSPRDEPNSAGLHLADVPGARSVELRVGCACGSRHHPDYRELQLLAAILGGGSESRLMASLRDRHGWAYAVRSRVTAWDGGGQFLVGTAVAPEHAGSALREVLREVERLGAEILPEEVQAAANSLAGSILRAISASQGLAELLQNMPLHGLGEDHSARHLEQLGSITAEDLSRAARRDLGRERLTIVVAGPAREARLYLEEIGKLDPVDGRDDLYRYAFDLCDGNPEMSS